MLGLSSCPSPKGSASARDRAQPSAAGAGCGAQPGAVHTGLRGSARAGHGAVAMLSQGTPVLSHPIPSRPVLSRVGGLAPEALPLLPPL